MKMNNIVVKKPQGNETLRLLSTAISVEVKKHVLIV